jgi:hypothetical protein
MMIAMPSLLAWLDHDPSERERMQRILALFQVRDTRDELGLGAIRDSFADQLFPGTSTIQTRLRYMLIVPWIYRALELERVASARVAAVARQRETALAEILARTAEWGVIGKLAGASLKRLPSSVYWAGLESWGIRSFHGSQDQYHRALDEVYRRRGVPGRRDDGEGGWERELETWHPKLPPTPERLHHEADLELTAEEADFLRERIITSHPESLLAYLAVHSPPVEVPFAWLHPDSTAFPAATSELLGHARLFSEVMNGAGILYNLMLAELAEQEELRAEHGDRFTRWSEEFNVSAVRMWDLERLWTLVGASTHTITYRAMAFVTEWVRLVRENPDGTLAKHDDARTLIRRRETLLKGGHSRFTNRSVLEQWGGYAGIAPLDYRWPTVRSYLQDLHAAMVARADV